MRSLLPVDSPTFVWLKAFSTANSLDADSVLALEYLVGTHTGELDISGRSPGGYKAGQVAPEVLAQPRAPSGSRALAGLAQTEALVTIDMSELATVLRHTGCEVQLAYADAATEASDAETLAEFVSKLGKLSAQVHPGKNVTAVLRAPKAVAGLREYLELCAQVANRVVVVGRDKYLPATTASELAKYFHRVDTAPGVRKGRAFVGTQPKLARNTGGAGLSTSYPKHTLRSVEVTSDEQQARWRIDLEVSAHGVCFGGTKVDEGSKLLITALAQQSSAAQRHSLPKNPEALPLADTVLDLGCGNGWLLVAAMTVLKARTGLASDISRGAVASARETCELNQVPATVSLGNAGHELPEQCADVVLLNPPFHAGGPISTEAAFGMIEATKRLLKSGGVLVMVHNSHLRYRARVEQIFGNSQQWARNNAFTVLAARKA